METQIDKERKLLEVAQQELDNAKKKAVSKPFRKSILNRIRQTHINNRKVEEAEEKVSEAKKRLDDAYDARKRRADKFSM